MSRWIDPVPELKRQLAGEILMLIEGRTQHSAASAMEAPQSRVSDLRRGKVETMSIDRMVQCLTRLGRKVEIRTARGRGGHSFPHWKIDRRDLRAPASRDRRRCGH